PGDGCAEPDAHAATVDVQCALGARRGREAGERRRERARGGGRDGHDTKERAERDRQADGAEISLHVASFVGADLARRTRAPRRAARLTSRVRRVATRKRDFSTTISRECGISAPRATLVRFVGSYP